MPSVDVNGVSIFYLEKGKGEEAILFSHGLLWSHHMFHNQIETLAEKYRVIAYDHRGQGQSEVKGPFDLDTLTEDAAGLIDALGLGKVHFAGLSMGGFVGIRLAARRPELVQSLMLMETSANAEPVENLPKYKTLLGIVRIFGMVAPVASQVMPIMFAESWLLAEENKATRRYWKRQLMGLKKSIVGPVEGVIYRKGVEAELSSIRCPTLVIVGDEDVATKPEKAKFIQMGIVGSKLHRIPGAGHSSCIEKPGIINQLLHDWLSAQTDWG